MAAGWQARRGAQLRLVLEYKLYARGVGPVLVLSPSGGAGGREQLVEFSRGRG